MNNVTERITLYSHSRRPAFRDTCTSMYLVPVLRPLRGQRRYAPIFRIVPDNSVDPHLTYGQSFIT